MIGGRYALYAAAVLVGIALATYQELNSRGITFASDEPMTSPGITMPTPDIANTSAANPLGETLETNMMQDTRAAVAETKSVANNNISVLGNRGTRFIAEHRNGVFIGYRVGASTSDTRFEVGSVIVAVDGVGVEDSAAGSELLIARLTNPFATVSILDQGGRQKSLP